MYSAAQVRQLDKRAQTEAGISGARLMRRAAAAAWRVLIERWPAARHIVVLAGPGNNGGDGYLLAAMARAANREVLVWRVGPLPLEGDAARAHAKYVQEGGSVAPYTASALANAARGTVIVDALFGIGLKRPLLGDAAQAVLDCHLARNRGAGVLALDLPSGLNSETGALMGAVIKADITVTFIGHKLGLHTGSGPQYAGRVVLDTLSLPPTLYADTPAIGALLHEQDLARALPRRARDAHKGSHGHVLIIGGDHGMAGAVVIAARAALRAGAGLVTVATRAAHAAALVAAQPEVMFRAVESTVELLPLINNARAIAIGPGLGTSAWGQMMWEAVKNRDHLVADADALNLLAENPGENPLRILTPHPGEASRLLGMTTAAVQRDRLATARALGSTYGGVVVLKGAGTLIHCPPSDLIVCPYGNPGMGVAGMGDALTGIIAGLLAQGLFEQDAAAIGVLAHALAGDAAAEAGERGLLPSDLIQALRAIVNPLPPQASAP